MGKHGIVLHDLGWQVLSLFHGAMGDVLMDFDFMVQDAGIDDDVVVMTEDFDDLMDEDAVVLPDANYTSVSPVNSMLASSCSSICTG